MKTVQLIAWVGVHLMAGVGLTATFQFAIGAIHAGPPPKPIIRYIEKEGCAGIISNIAPRKIEI